MAHPTRILLRALLGDVRQMILAARQEVGRTPTFLTQRQIEVES
jgi:hypothetical protein